MYNRYIYDMRVNKFVEFDNIITFKGAWQIMLIARFYLNPVQCMRACI